MDAPFEAAVGPNNLKSLLIPLCQPPVALKLKEEDRISFEFAEWLREQTLSRVNFPFVWFHVPNENPLFRNPGALLKKRWLGLVPGAPDFVLVSDRISLFIEFKAKKGVVNPSQRLFKQWCDDQNLFYTLARSSTEAIQIVLKAWLDL